MNNIFVGNLSFEATKEDVIKLFEPFGSVVNVLILQGKKGKSRGYGFVDMPNEVEKNAAIAALQGKEFMWRVLSVSPVVPKAKDEPKYYNKTEGPPKPWLKGRPKGKPFRKKEGPKPAGTSKLFIDPSKKGFKMHHKVSGVPRSIKSTDGL